MRLAAALCAGIPLLVIGRAGSAIQLVKDGRSDYVLVLGKDASASEHRAAAEFKRFVLEISGAVIPTIDDSGEARAKAVYIGDSRLLRALGTQIDYESLGPEGYVIRTAGDSLVIAGGEPAARCTASMRSLKRCSDAGGSVRGSAGFRGCAT